MSEGRQTRGKGSQKAGRGPDSDMADSAESEQATDAQQTVDSFEVGETDSGGGGDTPGASTASSRGGSGGASDSGAGGRGSDSVDEQRESEAISRVVYESSRLIGRTMDSAGDDMINTIEEMIDEVTDKVEGEDEDE